MEHIIRYMGSLLRQPSNPFWNLAAQTRQVATTNMLVAMWPESEKDNGNPRGSKDLGDGYVLLGLKDTSPYHVSHSEQAALDVVFSGYPGAEDIDQCSVY